MLAAALLTVISFHNLFVGTMLCFLVSAAPAGLLAISLAVSAAGSMVIVNTVVLVKARFGLGEIEVAWRWRFGCGTTASWFCVHWCRAE